MVIKSKQSGSEKRASILKMPEISIRKLKFNRIGMLGLIFSDGRELFVPLKYFPELKKLSLLKRKKYTIVDDRTILFRYSDHVYNLDDFLVTA